MSDHVGRGTGWFGRNQKFAKTIVTGIGALTTAGLLTSLPVERAPCVGLATALLTTYATYKVPNVTS
ncbi:hypothetical protein EDF63_1606 [Curtobacterium sp. JUb34]|nr:hypothetical protein EDF63_1606 [Curtobacterium sp. JUb34]